MKKINLDDYFQKFEFKGRICDSPEELAETEELNKKMRVVVRDYNYRAAKSKKLAHRLILDRCR